MNSEVQIVVLVPAAVAAACTKLAKEQMTSRSCWVRQLIGAAIKKESSQDAA